MLGGELVGLLETSAAAPEFAGLLAVEESFLRSRMGNENDDLYTLGALQPFYHSFHQGIPGNDGVISVPQGRPGYNTIDGLGSPVGAAFALVPFAPSAGDSQTASNP